MPDTLMPDTLDTPLNVALAVLACAGAAALSFRRHFSFGQGYRHRRINWMVVCLAFVAVGFVLFVHLVNLAGVETGRR